MNNFLEITSNDNWFKQHPEKIAGEEYETTSFYFPIMVRGTKEDVLRITGMNKTSDMKKLALAKAKAKALKVKLSLGKLGVSEIDKWLAKQNHYKADTPKFEKIVKLLESQLKKHNLSDDFVSLSKSKTDYGQSWYFIFDNGLEIRISDHSVTSGNRIMDNKYIAFISTHENFNAAYAKDIIDGYKKRKLRLKKQKIERNKLCDLDKKQRELIDKKSSKFIEKLKKQGKNIGETNKTYQTLEIIKEKHPDWEYIFQEPNQNAFQYKYVAPNNGFIGKYFISKEYFEFLKQQKAL